MKKGLIITIGVLGLFYVIGIMSPTVANEKANAKKEVINSTPKEIVAEFEANEIRAESKFSGKIVKIKGIIETIGVGIDSYVLISDGNKSEVRISLKDKSQGVNLNKGDSITFFAEYSSYTLGIVSLKNGKVGAYQ